MIIEKDFVLYKEALDLKEIGFDGPCFGYFLENKTKVSIDAFGSNTNSNFSKIFNENKFRLVTPTYSQAFNWFREKYKLHSHIGSNADHEIYGRDTYHCAIFYKFGTDYSDDMSNDYSSYEEAELECLKKLIEIVKEK